MKAPIGALPALLDQTSFRSHFFGSLLALLRLSPSITWRVLLMLTLVMVCPETQKQRTGRTRAIWTYATATMPGHSKRSSEKKGGKTESVWTSLIRTPFVLGQGGPQ